MSNIMSNIMSRFSAKNDPRLLLVHNNTQAFSEAPQVKELRLLHTGYVLEKHIKKNADIYPKTLVGIHPDKAYGYMFSPVRGKIREVGPRFIVIDVLESQPDDPVVEPLSKEEITSYFSLEDKEFVRQKIRELGLNVLNIAEPCETLIVSGLNAQPGITWAEPLLSAHLDTVLLGLEMQKLFAQPKEIILALPSMERIKPIDYVKIQHVDPRYPISVPTLLKKALHKDSKDTNVVSIHALWRIGHVIETGLPLTETIITLSAPGHGANYIIKEGTRVIDLLEDAKFPVEQGDTIVLDGPLRGASIALAERGIPKFVRSVSVLPKGSVPELEGSNPCCNCGACDRICPAKLAPSMISRYAEFHMYDKCKEWNADTCLDCGLCGFVCIMRRPVLQYMRLANEHIRLSKREIVLSSQEGDTENQKQFTEDLKTNY